MKTRIGFVSNSSSSSYVVVPKSVVEEYEKNRESRDIRSFNQLKLLFAFSGEVKGVGLFDSGEKNFGWQVVRYHDLESKWNWLVLQAYYDGSKAYLSTIENFLSKVNHNLKINWADVDEQVEKFNAYIDHQSIDAQATFAEVKAIGIDEFLVNENCFIQNGNDNL